MYEVPSGMYEAPEYDSFHTVFFDFVQFCSRGLRNGGKESVTLSEEMGTHLVISKGTELLRVPIERLIYIAADGNYSNVVTQDGRKALVSFQLGQIEDMIDTQLGEEGSRFSRMGRGLIINMDFVYSIDISKQTVVLSDCLQFRHELSASREVLIKLKAYIDAMTQNYDG